MSNAITLWVNTQNNKIYSGWQSLSELSSLSLMQGDNVSIEIHTVEGIGDASVEIPFTTSSEVRCAIGRLDNFPTSGSMSFTYGANTISFPLTKTLAEINALINAMPSIVSAGGVVLYFVNKTTYRLVFNQNGSRLVASIDATSLYPKSSSSSIVISIGTISSCEIQHIKIKTVPVAYSETFIDTEQPEISIEEINTQTNRITLTSQPMYGSFTISNGTKTTGAISCKASAADVYAALNQVGISTSTNVLNARMYSVLKNTNLSWDISRIKGPYEALTISTIGIVGFSGKIGTLNMSSYEIEDILSGSSSVSALIEIEVTNGAVKNTIYQGTVKILNDLIDNAIYEPTVFPSNLSDSPHDGVLYGRLNGAWHEVDPQANLTGYALESWVTTNFYPYSNPSSYIPESNVDGNIYGRKNGQWETVLPTTGGELTGSITLAGIPNQVYLDAGLFRMSGTAGHLDVTATGIAFPDSTVQTTAATGGGTWGSITGTLANQTDLQLELDGKLSLTGGSVNYLRFGGNGIFIDQYELIIPSNSVINAEQAISASLPNTTIQDNHYLSLADTGFIKAQKGDGSTLYDSTLNLKVDNFEYKYENGTDVGSVYKQFKVGDIFENPSLTLNQYSYIQGDAIYDQITGDLIGYEIAQDFGTKNEIKSDSIRISNSIEHLGYTGTGNNEYYSYIDKNVIKVGITPVIIYPSSNLSNEYYSQISYSGIKCYSRWWFNSSYQTNYTELTPTGLRFSDGSIQITAALSLASANNYALISSPTFTGDPKAPTPLTSDNDTSIATTAFVKAQGYLTSAPVTSVAGRTGVVTLAVADISGAAPLASPALTGTPTSTTATANTNTTQVATTAFVVGQAGSATPIVNGTAAVGTSLLYARQDHVHPSDTSKANLSGASFTGKINLLASTTSSAPMNIGNGTAPTSPASGDIWLTSNTMYFQDNASVTRQVANVNSTNSFNSPQIIDTTSATLPALRVTQKGTAVSFIVEDSINPDTTAFVIDANGNVGIGVAAGYTATNKFEVVGAIKATSITFDGTKQYSVSNTQTNPFGNGNISHAEYPLEMLVSYNGSTYAMPMRLVSTP